MGSSRVFQLVRRVRVYGCGLAVALCLSGCFTLGAAGGYRGPVGRPAEFEKYYKRPAGEVVAKITPLRTEESHSIERIQLTTPAGAVTLDYFHGTAKNDDLVLVFPVLGGKNTIVDYFANQLARSGIDAAVIHRNDDFKDPAKVTQLEEILRAGLVRDRFVIDYFERDHGKKDFGAFGVSRGGINASLTAGVDPRLKYNMIVLGGSDLVALFEKSNVRRMREYRERARETLGMDEEQFFGFLRTTIKTDPKHLAPYIDARNTLLVLALFDRSVPFRYGLELRDRIGKPETVVLFTDHALSAAYTNLLEIGDGDVFPFGYLERRATDFFKRSFGTGQRKMPNFLRVLEVPFDALGYLLSAGF